MGTLASATIGRPVKVICVAGDGDVSLRLMEMGVTPGVDIRCLGTAPLGDPLEFELRGYRLSLRKSEAAHVELDANFAN